MKDLKYHFCIFPCLLAVHLMKGFWRFPFLLALINSLMASLIVAFFFKKKLSWEVMINYGIQQADGWQILFDIMQPWFRGRAIILTPWLLHEEPWQLYCPLPEGSGIGQLATCISESLPQPKTPLDPSSGHLPRNTVIPGCGFANILANYILTISCTQAVVAPCLCSLKAPRGRFPSELVTSISHWSNWTSLGIPVLQILNTSRVMRSKQWGRLRITHQ